MKPWTYFGGRLIRCGPIRSPPSGFNPTLDGFCCRAMTVLAQILVCIAGLEQSLGHGFFVDPPACNHPSKAEGHGIEHLITLAGRGGTEFGGGALERCCRINLAAQAAIRSRPGILVDLFSV